MATNPSGPVGLASPHLSLKGFLQKAQVDFRGNHCCLHPLPKVSIGFVRKWWIDPKTALFFPFRQVK